MMVAAKGDVDELVWFDRLEQSLAKQAQDTGSIIDNISHWNASSSFTDKLCDVIDFGLLSNVFDYVYDEKDHSDWVLNRLGIFNQETKATITPSGTTSIEMIVGFLNSKGVKRVDILAPVYFTVPYSFNKCNIEVCFHYLEAANNFEIPLSLFDKKREVIWITNPIFSTAENYSYAIIEFIENALEDGSYVVCDESLCWDTCLIGPKFATQLNYFSIYNPLKKLGINAIKYSAIQHNRKWDEFLKHWSDIIYGGLNLSNKSALLFFRSDAYKDAMRVFEDFIIAAYNNLRTLLANISNIRVDGFSVTPYMSCYCDKLTNNDFLDFQKCWDLMKLTSCAFIPNHRNHFSSSDYFSFRINMTRVNRKNIGGLVRLTSTISDLESNRESPCLIQGDILIVKANRHNWKEKDRIKLLNGQSDFVWTVTESLARAYIKPNGLELQPYFIYLDGIAGGFFFVEYATKYADTITIGGFQLDKERQRSNYGRDLLMKIVEFARLEYPFCRRIKILVNSQNKVAINLFTKFGFTSTGSVYGDEIEYLMNI